ALDELLRHHGDTGTPYVAGAHAQAPADERVHGGDGPAQLARMMQGVESEGVGAVGEPHQRAPADVLQSELGAAELASFPHFVRDDTHQLFVPSFEIAHESVHFRERHLFEGLLHRHAITLTVRLTWR